MPELVLDFDVFLPALVLPPAGEVIAAALNRGL
jgi:hypothetical protein